MTVQKSLFQNGSKSTRLIEFVPLSKIELSEHNPRRTWDEKHIIRLAELIEQNGYDGTDAIKCYEEGGKYKCFAGSNRFKACQKINRDSMPVFLYEGYTPEEIWRMAYDDNEQEGVQLQFSPVDVWLDYKDKADKGWTQQKIARTLSVSQTNVAFRINFAEWGADVHKKFITNDSLKEGHARELRELLQCNILGTQSSILCEIIDAVTKRYTNPTSKNFKNKVEEYNRAIRAAKEYAEQLSGEWKEQFIERIKDERSAAIIANQGRIFLEKQRQSAEKEYNRKRAELDALEKERLEKEKQLEKESKIKAVSDRLFLGDSRKEAERFPMGIKLVFTDPPYGTDFQSNHRNATSKNKKIKGDSSIEDALGLSKSVMQKLWPKMAEDSAVLMWCDWEHEPEFRATLKEVGFTIKNSIIWHKSNHNMGDLKGAFGVKHERLIFAIKGRPVLNTRLPDVLHGDAFLPTEHPTPKPIDLIGRIIESLTLEQDIVADPFMGSGATGVPSVRMNRIFYGCEIDKEWWEDANKFVIKEISQ